MSPTPGVLMPKIFGSHFNLVDSSTQHMSVFCMVVEYMYVTHSIYQITKVAAKISVCVRYLVDIFHGH